MTYCKYLTAEPIELVTVILLFKYEPTYNHNGQRTIVQNLPEPTKPITELVILTGTYNLKR